MTVKQMTPAQLAAARARQEAASVSPTAAQSLGPAMGTSFNFDPNAAPNDLPEPGAAPGGAPRGGPRPETFGDDAMIGPKRELPDDREALRAAGMLGGDPPPSAPAATPRQPNVVKASQSTHPLLQQLRQDLGLHVSLSGAAMAARTG